MLERIGTGKRGSRAARTVLIAALAVIAGACVAQPAASAIGTPVTATVPGATIQPESASAVLDGVSQSEAEALVSIARADPMLIAELAGADSRVVQVIDPKKGGGPIVWFVDYSKRRTIAIEFALDRTSIAIRRIDRLDAAPISPGERALAAEIALRDSQVRARAGIGAQLILHSITGGRCPNTRCLVVFVQAQPVGTGALIGAVVDLSTRAVDHLLPDA